MDEWNWDDDERTNIPDPQMDEWDWVDDKWANIPDPQEETRFLDYLKFAGDQIKNRPGKILTGAAISAGTPLVIHLLGRGREHSRNQRLLNQMEERFGFTPVEDEVISVINEQGMY